MPDDLTPEQMPAMLRGLAKAARASGAEKYAKPSQVDYNNLASAFEIAAARIDEITRQIDALAYKPVDDVTVLKLRIAELEQALERTERHYRQEIEAYKSTSTETPANTPEQKAATDVRAWLFRRKDSDARMEAQWLMDSHATTILAALKRAQPETTKSQEEIEAPILRIEHGWICIREPGGWLLFSTKVSALTDSGVELKLDGQAPRTSVPPSTRCEWGFDHGDGAWQTGCGHLHLFLDAGPKENDYKYCPYCGKTLDDLGQPPGEPEESTCKHGRGPTCPQCASEPLAAIDWHYGPTPDDPDPGKMWHRDCGGEVWFIDGGHICNKCNAVDEQPEHEPSGGQS